MGTPLENLKAARQARKDRMNELNRKRTEIAKDAVKPEMEAAKAADKVDREARKSAVAAVLGGWVSDPVEVAEIRDNLTPSDLRKLDAGLADTNEDSEDAYDDEDEVDEDVPETVAF